MHGQLKKIIINNTSQRKKGTKKKKEVVKKNKGKKRETWGERESQKQKSKKKENWQEQRQKKNLAHVQVHMGILVSSHLELFSPQFSPYFGEKAFWWVQGENTWAYQFFFSLFPPNQTTTKNAISPIFSPQFFILPKILPNKHKLKKEPWTIVFTRHWSL